MSGICLSGSLVVGEVQVSYCRLCCLSSLESSQLVDCDGEGVGNNRGNDQEGEDEDQQCWHYQPDILAGHRSLLLVYHVLNRHSSLYHENSSCILSEGIYVKIHLWFGNWNRLICTLQMITLIYYITVQYKAIIQILKLKVIIQTSGILRKWL